MENENDKELKGLSAKNIELVHQLKVLLPDEESSIEEEPQFRPINVASIQGLLIAKKTAVGTKSEGWMYYILPNDQYKDRWAEVLVRKKTMLWQNDPQLHPMIDKMVKIKGDIIETRKSITVDCIEIGLL